MKRFEELVVGDFSGMDVEQIADCIERASQSYSRQDIYKHAEEMAREIFMKELYD